MTAPSRRIPVSEPEIPEEVLALLHERLTGLHEIKALVLMHRDPSRVWSPSAVAADLRWSDDWGVAALENLTAAGLIVGTIDGFSYRPATPDLDAAVAALAEIHGEDGLDVIRILNSKAFDRIRSAALTLGDVIVTAKSRTNIDEGSG
jgi:hypothetical protein